MIKLSILLVFAANLVGCKSNECPPEPLTVIAQSPSIWKSHISHSPASSLNSRPIYYNNKDIIGKKEQTGYSVI